MISVVEFDPDAAVELVTVVWVTGSVVVVIVVVVPDCGEEVEFVLGAVVPGSIEVVRMLRVVFKPDTEVVLVTLVYIVGGLCVIISVVLLDPDADVELITFM